MAALAAGRRGTLRVAQREEPLRQEALRMKGKLTFHAYDLAQTGGPGFADGANPRLYRWSGCHHAHQ